MAKVLAHDFAEKAMLEDTSFGKTPPVLAAIDALNRVMQIAERFVSIDEKLGPITHAELRQLAQAIAAMVFRFVPAERQDEAYEFLNARCRRRGDAA
jgi:protein gp37